MEEKKSDSSRNTFDFWIPDRTIIFSSDFDSGNCLEVEQIESYKVSTPLKNKIVIKIVRIAIGSGLLGTGVPILFAV